MARILDAFEQILDDSGNPVVDGTIEFFESGSSSVKKTTYSDSSLTNANANPLDILGDGRVPDNFGNGLYRVIVRNSLGEKIATKDPVGGDITESYGSNWLETQSYSIRDVVRQNDKYWESKQNNNIGNSPISDVTNTFWIDVTNPKITFTSTNGITLSFPNDKSVQIIGPIVPTRQTFTAVGAFTWNKPANCRYIFLRMVGGGGGGGASHDNVFNFARCGGGGGGGGYIEGYIDVSAIASIAGSIGAGGAIVTNGNGLNGGITIFSDLVCFGGLGGFIGGQVNSLPVDISGRGGVVNLGVTFTGMFGIRGNDGGPPTNQSGVLSGVGGTSPFGGGSSPGWNANANNADVAGTGGPGGAVSSSVPAVQGGTGFQGQIIIDEFY